MQLCSEFTALVHVHHGITGPVPVGVPDVLVLLPLADLQLELLLYAAHATRNHIISIIISVCSL